MGLSIRALNIGKAIIKVIVCIAAKRPDMICEIGLDTLEEVFSTFTSDVFVANNMKMKFAGFSIQIGKDLANFLKQFDADENAKESIAEEVERCIDNLDITMDEFSSWNFRSGPLADKIFNQCKQTGYSTNEVAIMKQCCEMAAQDIIKIVPNIPDFTINKLSITLERFDQIEERIIAEIQQLANTMQANQANLTSRFEQEYRECVISQNQTVNLFASSIDASLGTYNLSVAYVNLQMKLEKGNQKLNIEQLFKQIKPQRPTDFPKILIVAGEAGCGKTTLLQWLAVNAANRRLSEEVGTLSNVIPFMITLRNVSEWETFSLGNVIKTAMRVNPIEPPNNWLDDIARQGKALILLDGWDEISELNRCKAITWMNELKSRYPKSQIIVSTRPLDNYTRFESSAIARILPMDRHKIQVFIRYWHKAVLIESALESKENANSYASKAWEQISNNYALMSLARNPLLCAMICGLHYKNKSILPKNKIELYEDCCKMLLEDRDARRDIHVLEEVTLNYTDKTLLIEDLSYWMLRNDYTSAPKSEVVEHTKQKLQNMKITDTVSVEHIIDYLISRSGILREPEKGKIDFIHKTFMEYMAAKEISHLEDWGVLRQKALNFGWRETILIAIAFSNQKKADEYIAWILDCANEEKEPQCNAYYVLLALSCVENVQELSPSNREKVYQAAHNVIPPTIENEAVIAKMGEWIVPLLCNRKNYDDDQRLRCINLLAQHNSVRAANMLKTYLNEKTSTDILKNVLLATEQISTLNIYNASVVKAVDYYLKHKRGGRIALPSNIFSIYRRMQNNSKHFFSSVQVEQSDEGDDIYKYLKIDCDTLYLTGPYITYSILNGFENVHTLFLDVYSNTPLERLEQYRSLEKLKQLSITIQQDAHILFSRNKIFEKIEKLNMTFQSQDFEFYWEVVENINNINEIHLNFPKEVMNCYWDWNQISFCEFFGNFSSEISVALPYDKEVIEEFIHYSDITEIDSLDFQRLKLILKKDKDAIPKGENLIQDYLGEKVDVKVI